MNFGKRKVGKLWDDEFDIGTNRVKLRWALRIDVSNVLLERIQFFENGSFRQVDETRKLTQQKSGQWKKLEVQEKTVKVDFEQYFNG
jgi:hypothetical protein